MGWAVGNTGQTTKYAKNTKIPSKQHVFSLFCPFLFVSFAYFVVILHAIQSMEQKRQMTRGQLSPTQDGPLPNGASYRFAGP